MAVESKCALDDLDIAALQERLLSQGMDEPGRIPE
jgi:hypothetical protein